MKIGLVVPHIFMQQRLLPHIIFSPGTQALQLAEGLGRLGTDVTLFSPGPVHTAVRNVTADLTLFEQELAGRGDDYTDLLKKHPFTFITLARQVQSEVIAKAYAMANSGELDIVHIYTNEEDIALPFAQFCRQPVVFTHHDPFNFLVRYKNIFPKYSHLNWLSMSFAQRGGMPADTTWVGNIYHGLEPARFVPNYQPSGDYVAYLGRIVEPKGVHVAIAAAKQAGVKLKIAGKHYAGHRKDTYWQTQILPYVDGRAVEYAGHLRGGAELQDFLGNARGVLVPSTFEEPFGMVVIEALACGTPVIGLRSGAIPEIVEDGKTGFVVDKEDAIQDMAMAIGAIKRVDRRDCRRAFEERFTLERMCGEHLTVYRKLTGL